MDTVLDVQTAGGGGIHGDLFAADKIIARMKDYDAFVHSKHLHKSLQKAHTLFEGTRSRIQENEPHFQWQGLSHSKIQDIVENKRDALESMEDQLNEDMASLLSMLQDSSQVMESTVHLYLPICFFFFFLFFLFFLFFYFFFSVLQLWNLH